MAVLPINEAIVRFDQNEDRINKFVNEYGTYTPNSGLPEVETLPSFIQRNSEALNLLAATNVRGDWSAFTSYSIWDEVKYSGTWYRCVVAHTSSSTFDSNNWRLSQGVTLGQLSSPSGAGLIGTANGQTLANNLIFDSIAALRLNSSTASSGLKTCSVTSYYGSTAVALHPLFQGTYYIKTSDTTSADNGGTIIVDAAGNRWYLSRESEIFPETFGAKADGTTNDAAAFQSAINIASHVNLSGSHYYINSPVELRHKVSITGVDKTATEFWFGPSGKLTISGTPTNDIGYLTIEKIGLTNQGGGNALAIDFSYSAFVTFSDCIIYGTSVRLSAYKYITFSGCTMFAGTVTANHPVVNEISQTLKVLNCSGTYAFDVSQTADVYFDVINFVGNLAKISITRGNMPDSFYPPVFLSDVVLDSGDDVGLYLLGVVPHISDIFVSSGRTSNQSGIVIIGCVDGDFTSVQSRFNGLHGAYIGYCKNLKFFGGSFNDNKKYGIRIGDSSDIRFIGTDAIHDPDWFGGNYVQEVGISDEPSNCTNITVIGGNLTNNSVVPAYLPSQTNIIIGNKGYGSPYPTMGAVTVESLPPAASVPVGTRSFVSNANSAAFSAPAVGGGSSAVPVYSTSTGWFIG